MSRPTSRRAVRMLLAVVSTALLLVPLTSGAARAEPSGVQVSLDSSGPFADGLPHSLFRGTGRLVPGDRVERTLYVRNDAATDTRTTVQVGFDRSNELSDALDFRVVIGEAEATVSGDAAHQTFAGPLTLAPGEVQPIDVVMTFDRATRTQAMRQSTEVELRVTITETTGAGLGCREDLAVDRNGVTTDTERPRCVPTSVTAGETGTVADVSVLPVRDPVVAATVAVLAALVGAGLALVAARRRREVAERG